MALAPEGNARLQIAREAVTQALARSAQSRAALLPDISGAAGEQNLTRNLAALGVRLETPIAGFRLPETVGPFNVFDARVSAVQNILDAGAIRRFQASRAAVEAARGESESVSDQVAAQVARAYLAAQRADALLETARANVTLAEALAAAAGRAKDLGSGLTIDVTRARAELANARQHVIAANNEQRRARLQLLRFIGMKPDTGIVLTDVLAYAPVERLTLQEAAAAAQDARADIRAQRRRAAAARAQSSAAALERLPTLAGFADYGSIGGSINHASPTRTYGLALRVPLYDGGRREARRAESLSQLRQERIRASDLEEQAALEVRLALDALESAEGEIEVSEEGVRLAEEELAQARRRYEGGVAGSLEVTGAQTRLERARGNRVGALFSYNLARIDLGAAMGAVNRYLP
jgi:outer membrane protein TolC